MGPQAAAPYRRSGRRKTLESLKSVNDLILGTDSDASLFFDRDEASSRTNHVRYASESDRH